MSNLKWGWSNGRRFQVYALVVALATLALTWFVSFWFSFVNILAVVASAVWGIGFDRGHNAGMKLILDSQIEALERARAVVGEHAEGEGELAVIVPVDGILEELHARRESLR